MAGITSRYSLIRRRDAVTVVAGCTTEDFVHFEFETTRSGQVSRDILGDDFGETLVTDCYSGYEAQSASAWR